MPAILIEPRRHGSKPSSSVASRRTAPRSPAAARRYPIRPAAAPGSNPPARSYARLPRHSRRACPWPRARSARTPSSSRRPEVGRARRSPAGVPSWARRTGSRPPTAARGLVIEGVEHRRQPVQLVRIEAAMQAEVFHRSETGPAFARLQCGVGDVGQRQPVVERRAHPPPAAPPLEVPPPVPPPGRSSPAANLVQMRARSSSRPPD